jgi:mono/diheme cytochrome c family protein
MWAEFQAGGRDVPSLTSRESADLFSWFYTTLYFSPAGDAGRGRALYQSKNCAACHSAFLDTRPGNPAFERWARLGPMAWAERMWNHVGDMDTAVVNRGLAWPVLSEQDIADLMTYVVGSSAAGADTRTFESGEPERGRGVFEDACESCHSFGDVMQRVDLLRKRGPSSVTGYIAAMWNHAPNMRRRGGALPVLNAGEMADLVTFLFTQRYFFEQGDIDRGRTVYEAKCATCHESRRREMGAPELAQASEVYSPVTLTSALWRHGPKMLQATKREGLSWPTFQGTEMPDLIAYLNSRLIKRVAVRSSY